jgi:hypothetical protein
MNFNVQVKIATTSSTTKVPAPGSVQSVEASHIESLTEILPAFSTEFSTNMLKTFDAPTANTASPSLGARKSRRKGG